MKHMLYLLAAMYIIGGIVFIKFFIIEKNTDINIEQIKKSIVIIIPEEKLISYKNNPKGVIEDFKNSGMGAGFFINSDGTIQTVNHIIENDKINYKILYDNKEYNSKVLSRNIEQDLALLKIIGENNEIFKALKIENKSKIGDEIISFGIDIINTKIISNTGTIISEKNKLENVSNLLEISNTLQPGFSGGPIVNKNGRVIGVNYAISEGKNYGVLLNK